MSSDNHFTAQLQSWLDPLDEAAVECDGMSRIISALLTDSLIEHTVMGGLLIDMHKLNDPSVGHEEGCACTHWWIELPTGHVIDYRARMMIRPYERTPLPQRDSSDSQDTEAWRGILQKLRMETPRVPCLKRYVVA